MMQIVHPSPQCWRACPLSVPSSHVRCHLSQCRSWLIRAWSAIRTTHQPMRTVILRKNRCFHRMLHNMPVPKEVAHGRWSQPGSR